MSIDQSTDPPLTITMPDSQYSTVQRVASADLNTNAETENLPAIKTKHTEGIARSKSRYRRPRVAAKRGIVDGSPVDVPSNEGEYDLAKSGILPDPIDEEEDPDLPGREGGEELQNGDNEVKPEVDKETVLGPKEKFGIFSRKIWKRKTKIPNSPALQQPSVPARAPGLSREPAQELGPSRKQTTNTVKQAQEGIVAQNQFPTFASSLGQRRVRIRYNHLMFHLPVTKETRPLDLIRTAADILAQDFPISNLVLLESYDRLGLQRQIRRYEYIVDIMNSWDDVQESTLVILDTGVPQYNNDLRGFNHIPKLAPNGLTVEMYHSQRAGEWNKRYVTLLSVGQIFISEHEDSKVTEEDVEKICHLSDFDIYTPMSPQVSQVLGPPQATCCAIKSQQKTNMFYDTSYFVHYFSTDDEEVAEKWYSTVQQWRSWYLYYQLGQDEEARYSVPELLGTIDLNAEPGYPIPASAGRSPSGGRSQPVLIPGRFGSAAIVEMVDDDSEEENRPREIPSHLRLVEGILPPLHSFSYPPIGSTRALHDAEATEVFDQASLLGRSYTQRRERQIEMERRATSDQFLERSPTVMNPSTSLRHFPSVSTRRSEGSSRMQRGASQRQRPLVDLSPTFREAPQWDRSRKGRGVGGIPGVPLVELATSPHGIESEIPGTLFRR